MGYDAGRPVFKAGDILGFLAFEVSRWHLCPRPECLSAEPLSSSSAKAAGVRD